jgi:MscS family membrane protein
LKQFFDHLGVHFLAEPFIIKILIALLITAVAHVILRYVLKRLLKATKMTVGFWDDVIVHAALKPLLALLWVFAVAFILSILHERYQETLLSNFLIVRDVGITLCIAWFFWRLIDYFSQQYLQSQYERGDMVDQTTVDALAKLTHLIVFIATVLTVMQTLGFSVSGLLAAGGIGGIAIGFAAKDILANFFGGLTIYLDRPFNVGDWIRSPDKDIEGVVEMINWRHTRIRRFNKNPIYVPNSVFTTVAVENPSRMTNRRIKENIGIRYDDIGAMADIVKDVKAMLQQHAHIDNTQTLIVNFNAFNASSVDFMVYTFTRTVVWEEYHEVRQDILLKIAAIVAQHKAQIAFPTQTLHIARNAQENIE